MGAKKKPFYRLVAVDSESPRDGKFLEILGFYDPMKDPEVIEVHEEKVNYWLQKGARATGSAEALLKQRLEESMTAFQSPAGYFYEKDGPDWGYFLSTHHSDLHMAWHYARRKKERG